MYRGASETKPAAERLLLYALVLIVAGLSMVPIGRLLLEALAETGAPSLGAIGRALRNPITWEATRNSLVTALGGTLIALVVGTVFALVVTLTDIRARGAIVFCFVLPLMIAPQVTALAWLQVAGPASPLLKMLGMAPPIGAPNPLYSRDGIIALLGIQYAPLVFLTLRAGLRTLPRELVEAASASGASKITVIRTIVLPLMTPALVAGTALAFVSCIGNFGIPAFLGIPSNVVVLPTLIYQRLSGLGPSVLAEVTVLSTLVGLIAVVGLLLQDRMLGKRDYRIPAVSPTARAFALGRYRLAVEVLVWAFCAGILFVPMLALLLTSFVPAYGVDLSAATATVANYAYVLIEHAATRRALLNSLVLASAAAVLIVLIAIPLAYFMVQRRSRALNILRVAAELPYAVPGVVLSIAAILLFLKPVPMLGITLYNTIWIILFAYLARFLILGLKPIVGASHQIDRALEEAAQAAGARLIRRLATIIAPLVAPAAVAGALLVALTAFNELTVSALLWSTGAETLGVVVFSLEQAGESNYAAAIAVVTVLLTLGLMLATLGFARRLPQGVLPWRD